MIDTAQIIVKAGNGGDGAATFHRAKYVPKGGPDGGDGGTGGSIIIKSVKKLNTLSLFHRQKRYEAENGQSGMKEKRHGKNGEDLIIEVPVGTQVISTDDSFKHDFVKEEAVIVAQGGKGGIGNTHFKSSTNQTPRQFTKGIIGPELGLKLELKILADVGIIGLPSSGKSTLLNTLTNSKAKTAEYHFTTLEPNLGVLSRNSQEIVLADIPGLIEGASDGKGLGHDFLKHIERTNLIIHIMDGLEGISDTKNLIRNYKTIRKELKIWESSILNKSEIVVINKIDITEVNDKKNEIKDIFNEIKIEPIFISAATTENINELVEIIFEKHNEIIKKANLVEKPKEIKKPRIIDINTIPNKRIVFKKTNHDL